MIAENVKNIRQRIINACRRVHRNPEEITLIAVSKTFGAGDIKKVVEAGLYDIGENYVQELRQKRGEVPDERVRWHFIGHLQSNKIKYIGDWIHMIHAVDSLSLGEQLSKWSGKTGRKIDVLVEVNTGDEESKFGVSLVDTEKFVKDLSKLPNINLKGLMTIGPFLSNPEDSRPAYRALARLKKSLEDEGLKMPVLSMGMSHDFEVAIEEGATMVRIGTAIFGSRVTRR
jgi:pyridoxal phosphate enzyme (YggS family)